ncbi:MAG: YtxH domain-containing protein [Gemmatimonadales bacterium]
MKAFAAGFLLGIFVAPRSGSASRQLLMDRLAEFFETGQRRFEELEDELADRRRSSVPLNESDWPEVDESMIGGSESGPGA